ncbi:MAG: NADPH:quinone reductase-like Zn-dependent oxidoreductase [Saprospiraceae bacterium]|jgi:NADPH:quinone reductase-like Zn-dependent oxidoreductase
MNKKRAVILEKSGGVENLMMANVDKPITKEYEVLLEAKAIGINPVDDKVREIEEVLTMINGEDLAAIIGWDVAGKIVSIGTNVRTLKKETMSSGWSIF